MSWGEFNTEKEIRNVLDIATSSRPIAAKTRDALMEVLLHAEPRETNIPCADKNSNNLSEGNPGNDNE